MILNKEHLLQKVSVYGLTKEKIESELASINEIEKNALEKGLVKMENEKATQDRDKIFQELFNEWGLYREVLKACFYKEDPQFLEGFGIRVPTVRIPINSNFGREGFFLFIFSHEVTRRNTKRGKLGKNKI